MYKRQNSDSTDTDWYMTNEVIQTLEDAQSSAEGGAYEYKLTYVGSDNAEKVLYDSSTVGGEDVYKRQISYCKQYTGRSCIR